MRIIHNKELDCISCGIKTYWQDGICNECTLKAQKYIPYSQIRRFYLLKRKKYERYSKRT